MLRDPSFDQRDLSHVSTIVMGGGPSSPALVNEARRRFGAAYSIRYSSTESGGVGTATAFDADDHEALHTVGHARAGIDVSVRDDAGRPVAAATGEVGEVWLRSPATMAGYWRDPEGTEAAIVDGWLRTGDLGRIDESGCLVLAGRQGEMFIRGGYNVFPVEVEAVLANHPGVSAVAVVPAAGRRDGRDRGGRRGSEHIEGRPRCHRRWLSFGRTVPGNWRRTSCPRRSCWSTNSRSPRCRSSIAGP